MSGPMTNEQLRFAIASLRAQLRIKLTPWTPLPNHDASLEHYREVLIPGCPACDRGEDPVDRVAEARSTPTEGLDVDFIAAIQALIDEVYVSYHTPSSEAGPEEWDVELLAPEQRTVERVIRHLARRSPEGDR